MADGWSSVATQAQQQQQRKKKLFRAKAYQQAYQNQALNERTLFVRGL